MHNLSQYYNSKLLGTTAMSNCRKRLSKWQYIPLMKYWSFSIHTTHTECLPCIKGRVRRWGYNDKLADFAAVHNGCYKYGALRNSYNTRSECLWNFLILIPLKTYVNVFSGTLTYFFTLVYFSKCLWLLNYFPKSY